MQVPWTSIIRRHHKAIAIIPVLLGIGLLFLTGRAFLFKSGAVWFLVVLAALAGIQAFRSVRSKLRRRKRDALVAFLQYGGYSIMAGAMALLLAVMLWGLHQPRWLTALMLVGMLMFFSSGLVYRRRTRKTVPEQKSPPLSS